LTIYFKSFNYYNNVTALGDAMSKIREKVLWISIPKRDIELDLGWWLCTSPQGGEEAVRSYIIRHPQIIERGLDFLSVELYLEGSSRVDVLFRKEKTYYIVEAKYEKWTEKVVRKQVLQEVEALRNTLERKRVNFERIMPVVVTSWEGQKVRRRYAISYYKKIRITRNEDLKVSH
jgi:hypothetical protein